MKKRVVILVFAAILLILAIVTGRIVNLCYVNIDDDDERIIEFAKNYVIETDVQMSDGDEVEKNNEIEIVSTSAVVKEKDMGIISVLVKYESEGAEKIKCVYFTRNNVFEKLYEIQGGLEIKKGEITACSQDVDGMNVAFIAGMDLSDEVTEYSVEKLEYVGKIENGWCLAMIQTEELTHFEVKTN